jgi:hypothetical protein
MTKRKRTKEDNELQNITQKTKDGETQTLLKNQVNTGDLEG